MPRKRKIDHAAESERLLAAAAAVTEADPNAAYWLRYDAQIHSNLAVAANQKAILTWAQDWAAAYPPPEPVVPPEVSE